MTSILVLSLIAIAIFFVTTTKGKEWIFGGKIIKTVNRELNLKGNKCKTKIKVHILKKKKESNNITIELSENVEFAWSIDSIDLSEDEANELISMLKEAVQLNKKQNLRCARTW